MNMSRKFNIANAPAIQKIGTNNLDIYIPRIDEKHSEQDVKNLFLNYGIGLVDYVDFVATKEPETKQIKYYSAFLKLTEWNPNGYWYNQIIVEKQNKIQISPFEFWVLLPAKTMISRSKVNTHQLVAYTDELFVKVGEIEKNVAENMNISSEHFKNLLAKYESQAKQIEQLMKIVQIQAEQLDRINGVLFEKKTEEIISRPRALTIEDLNQEQPQVKVQNTSSSTTYRPDDDDCFLSKPPVGFHNYTETVDPKRDIIRGSFSIDLDDILGPVAKSLGLTEEQAKKQLEKEISNSKRAVSSRNYCGNE